MHSRLPANERNRQAAKMEEGRGNLPVSRVAEGESTKGPETRDPDFPSLAFLTVLASWRIVAPDQRLDLWVGGLLRLSPNFRSFCIAR
jgi:hypothetical protein